MDKTNSNFRDGRIEEVLSTADFVKMKMSCSAVEGGQLTITLSPHPSGWVYVHFSGLAGKNILVKNSSANSFDILVEER